MSYFLIKIKLKILIFSTIQKSYCRHFSFMTRFVDTLRSAPFTGVHLKRWQAKETLWLTAMKVLWVSEGNPEGHLTAEQEKTYAEANTYTLCGRCY
jgi:hypothetical protein